jgi:hypothetical protein
MWHCNVRASRLADFQRCPKSSANQGKSPKNCCPEGACGAQTLYMMQDAVEEKNMRDGESARYLASGLF